MRDGDWVNETGSEFRGILKVLVDTGRIPGGVVVVGTVHTWEFVSVGELSPEHLPEVATGPAVRYDIASLTKLLATWTLTGRAVLDGLLDLDAPLGDYVPGGPFACHDVTTRQILTHTSRLDAETPLEEHAASGRDITEAILDTPSTTGGYRYIDRGFVLLGLVLERVLAAPLDRVATEMWAQAGMSATCYGPLPRGSGVAPTERRVRGAAPTWGVVHDEGAALLGGVAGHAGVFSTAADVGAYARDLLRSYAAEGGASELARFLRDSWTPQVSVEPGLSRGLGWLVTDTGVVHHTGFTGTSLHLHPQSGRYIGILTNAVHYGRDRGGRVQELRSGAEHALAAQPAL
ncbi:serine hydrolase domain-containing protein [Lipingzhangella sp. LS1_29]|uniref:Serine hydrolase domain-containing protein n=1 Tax=Lipingzhangella rawalii TaxID=2055835 RepID=A0ABU2H5F4_9ACTN|nr:serine hydrolase domain-containing protein [Lipingzhangella rawalii]MDS1270227.1 serine hydrolase domain-containing protein [Lipingzhangella rawalii]